MPEGDAVWRTAQRLTATLAGSSIVRSDFRVPSLATVDITGARVTDVSTRGKHLLIRLDRGLTIHSHLRVDGRWWTGAVGARPPVRAHEVRVVLATETAVAVGVRVHDLAVVATADEDRLVGHIGPDVLSDNWDPDEAVRRIQVDPGRAIGEALLDQRLIAGLGTIYRAETLFLAGVSPWTPVSKVHDLGSLIGLARRLMLANRERTGRTGIVTTGDTHRGRRVYVYDRAGQPCLRCGDAVLVATQGAPPFDRVVYWCGRCQATEAEEGEALRPRGSESPARASRRRT